MSSTHVLAWHSTVQSGTHTPPSTIAHILPFSLVPFFTHANPVCSWRPPLQQHAYRPPFLTFRTMTDHADKMLQARKEVAKVFNYLAERRKTYPKATGLDVYDPQPTDIIVTTYPKAGTTLMQQLVYQTAVATGGAAPNDPDGTNFVDICEVVPWLEYGPQMGVLAGESSPRVFKSHSPIEKFDIRKEKHVIVIRSPLKFPGSWLDFLYDSFPEEIATTDPVVRECLFDDTVLQDLLGELPSSLHENGEFGGMAAKEGEEEKKEGGAWFKHTKGWIDVVNDPNVLLFFYEDIIKDLETTTKRVAEFMERELSEADLQKVVSRCSREYMASDDRFKSILDEKVFGISSSSSKVKPSNREGFTKFKIKDEHLEKIKGLMMKNFGVETYQELMDATKAKQRDA